MNDDIKNQEVYAVEFGYGLRSRFVTANINLYHTYWGNRQISRGSRQQVIDPETSEPIQVDGNANYEGINQLHQGMEVDILARPIDRFTINGMVSFGNWRYTDDFSATWTPEGAQYQDQTRELTLHMKDVKVPDAAQMTFNGSINNIAYFGFGRTWNAGLKVRF